MKKNEQSAQNVAIIDLFAGPGGLGEGFSAFAPISDWPARFRVAVSIEKDAVAVRTLKLRALYRNMLESKCDPTPYYEFLSGCYGPEPTALYADLMQETEYMPLVRAATSEVLCAELGNRTDTRGIHTGIRAALKGHDDWVLIGGPPCQAYSQIGRSRKREYHDGTDEKNILYRQYLNIIARFWPSVFVMENVRGILSARMDRQVKNIAVFQRILRDLTNPARYSSVRLQGQKQHRYRIYSFQPGRGPQLQFEMGPGGGDLSPEDYLIRAEEWGIPQARHRVFLLGVREDLDIGHVPEIGASGIMAQAGCTAGVITVERVIRDLPFLRSRLSRNDSWNDWCQQIAHILDQNWFNRIAKSDPVLWREITNAVSQITHRRHDPGTGGLFGNRDSRRKQDIAHEQWYRDSRMGNVICNHESRSHMPFDLHRYLFSSCYGRKRKASPRLRDFPIELLPTHRSAEKNDFTDRFKVQLGGRPGSTVTSHIAKDGHYYIHPDPAQCRSLTVREAARLQTFPDNYFFVGNRTQQYHQVGNAVPPLLAVQLADVVSQILCDARRK